MTRRKVRTEPMIGTIQQIEVVTRPKGEKLVGQPVSLRIRSRVGGRSQEDWYSVARRLKTRVRELAQVPEQMVGETFEFAVDEDGLIVDFRRISS